MFWIGRIVSILSFQMMMVAIGWQLYSLTGSALDLGLLGIAQFMPMMVLTLLCRPCRRPLRRPQDPVVSASTAGAPARPSWRSARRWVRQSARHLPDHGPDRRRPRVRDPDHGLDHPGAGAARDRAVGDRLVRLGQPDRHDRRARCSAACCTSSARRRSMASPSRCGASARAFIFLIQMEPVPRSSEPMSIKSLMGGFRFVWKDRVDPRHHLARHVRGVPRRGDRRCSRYSPATSWRPARGGSGCCARRRASAPW